MGSGSMDSAGRRTSGTAPARLLWCGVLVTATPINMILVLLIVKL